MSAGRWEKMAVDTITNTAAGFVGTNDELEAMIRNAYPFVERKNHPYKIWLRTVKRYMAERRAIDGQQTAVYAQVDGLPLFEAIS